MKLTLERQIPLAFLVALLLLVLLAFFAYRSINSLNDAVLWEKHTQAVLLKMDETLALTTDAETSVRGFILTGDESFLIPFNSARQNIHQNLDDLNSLTADSPSQTQRLDHLEGLITQKFDLLGSVTEKRRTQSLEQTMAQANVGQGKSLMDGIRQTLDEMKTAEKNLLAERERGLDKSVSGAYRMIVLGSLAGIISLALANLAIFIEIGKRRRAEENLKTSNSQLENRVTERTGALAQINEDLKTEIEKREQYEKGLRESEIFRRAILDSLSAQIAVVDGDAKIVAVNKVWEDSGGENIFGTGEAAFAVGENYLEICENSAIAKEDKETILENLRAVLNNERSRFYFEYPYQDGDGQGWFLLQANALQETAAGGAVISHLDITDRKRVEREREGLLESEQSARREAEIANRLRDEFLATVSHELRAPLNSILGWSRLMQQGKLDDKSGAKAVETILRNAETQNRLIEDLLDVSRIISGKMRLEVITVSPTNIVETAMETVRPAAEAKNILLEIKEDTEVSHISGDPNRLQQVVWNLLSNAIKFTPNDGKVSVEIVRGDSAVEINVRDTGVGISEEFLPHVFDRFRQADASSIRKFGGLGLGLAIVRHLTEMHGGNVEVKSEGENKGATFTVKLPLLPPQTEDGKTNNFGAAKLLDDASRLSLDGLLILAVDDEDDTRQLLVQSLTFHGATVITAASARQGFTEFQDKKPDVIVSDIGMPEEDGYSLIRKIRAVDGSVPAIALTAFTRAQDRVRSLSAGFQTHVSKPVEPDELVTVIASLTKRLQANGKENASD